MRKGLIEKPSDFQEWLRVLNCLPYSEFQAIFRHLGNDWCEQNYADYFQYDSPRGPINFVMKLDLHHLDLLCQYIAERAQSPNRGDL